MVYLARIAYVDPTTSPAELCNTHRFTDRSAVEEHLLNTYLPSVYSLHPTPQPVPDLSPATTLRSYPPDQARRWLTFVARHLHEQQTRDLAWWQLHHALPQRAKKWGGGFILGLTDGLVCAIAIAIGAGLGGFASGLTGGLTAGLVIGLMAGPPSHPRQLNAQLRGRQRQATQELVVGITIGLGVGIAVGVVAGVVAGTTVGVTIGSVIGIELGLLGGLLQWLNAPADAIRSPSPTSVLRNDKNVSVMRMFVGVFGTGLACGLAVAVLTEVIVTPPIGIVVGGVGGLVAGLAAGLAGRSSAEGFVGGLVASAWGWSLASRWWLALAHKLPWRLMTFLNDAHQRGVLRQVGAVYQFRHAQLQDHLANTDTVQQ
jgi:hypothetical protein